MPGEALFPRSLITPGTGTAFDRSRDVSDTLPEHVQPPETGRKEQNSNPVQMFALYRQLQVDTLTSKIGIGIPLGPS